MLVDNPPRPDAVMTCDRCGASTDTRLGRYVFVVWGCRGRKMRGLGASLSPTNGEQDRRLCLCGPCGDVYSQRVEEFMLSKCRRTGLELVPGTGSPE